MVGWLFAVSALLLIASCVSVCVQVGIVCLCVCVCVCLTVLGVTLSFRGLRQLTRNITYFASMARKIHYNRELTHITKPK